MTSIGLGQLQQGTAVLWTCTVGTVLMSDSGRIKQCDAQPAVRVMPAKDMAQPVACKCFVCWVAYRTPIQLARCSDRGRQEPGFTLAAVFKEHKASW